jgi:hypothetical protein
MLSFTNGMAFFAIGVFALSASGSPAHAQTPQSNRIHIEYLPPDNPAHRHLYQRVRERRALEQVQEIFSPLRLPVALNVRIASCDGIDNAWYQRPTVTVCYEYLENTVLTNNPEEATIYGISADDAIVGQFFYTVAHEIGHAVFDMLNVPLFGRPEDAADQFAAYMMLKIGKTEAPRLIGGAAFAYHAYVQNPKVTVPITAFADLHGAPVQRLYNLLCIAYGADPGMFAYLVDKGYLPKERARACRVEYGEVNFAFEQLIDPHLDRGLVESVLGKSWLPNARRARSD